MLTSNKQHKNVFAKEFQNKNMDKFKRGSKLKNSNKKVTRYVLPT